ncbi:MAG: serine hydrolase [Clostridia bacterium]|nr:serine hydrolase [Clostridia bacterium]
MFEKVIPEQVGVSSADIKEYIELLENSGLATHSIVMVRHGKIFYENYWAPFHKDFLHRLYSDSKSYVALAIGFLVQEGKVDLDAPIVSYFDDEITKNANEYVKRQTVKNMLMMSTGFPNDVSFWFSKRPADRLRWYFDVSCESTNSKVPGSLFEYDSNGSFVLCALVEKISGMSFDEFMHHRLYSKIGVSPAAYTLKCPGGNSWGDSGVMCTAVDQARVMQFTMNNGSWEGKQILDENYVKTACSNLIDNNLGLVSSPDRQGYGYQIWRTRDNSFFFNGMGCQFAVAVPDKDIVFVINSDNQGIDYSKRVILNGFFDIIANRVSADTFPANDAAYSELASYSSKLELYALRGSAQSDLIPKINGKIYNMDTNPMGITKIKFTFDGDNGTMEYTNAQGDKKLEFGIDKNAFGKFPQEGYSDIIGNVFDTGNYYDCAASARIIDNDRMSILVQVIDKYFGRLNMCFSFNDNDEMTVVMSKVAEDFFEEYNGMANGAVDR